MADNLKPSALIDDISHRQSLMITGKKKEVMFEAIILKADEIHKKEQEELKALSSRESREANKDN